MKMNNSIPRGVTRGYGADSKRQKIIQYFRDNPDARPVVVAERFGYNYGSTWDCKKVALKTSPQPDTTPGFTEPPRAEPTEKLQDVIDHLYLPPAPEAKPVEPVDLWRGFGEWMPREQLVGYLRGLVMDKMARPLANHKDMREASRAATKLAELMGG